MVRATSSLSLGDVSVLLVNVSVPARVAKVPVVGSVTEVVALEVRVMLYAPEVTKELLVAKVNTPPEVVVMVRPS